MDWLILFDFRCNFDTVPEVMVLLCQVCKYGPSDCTMYLVDCRFI